MLHLEWYYCLTSWNLLVFRNAFTPVHYLLELAPLFVLVGRNKKVSTPSMSNGVAETIYEHICIPHANYHGRYLICLIRPPAHCEVCCQDGWSFCIRSAGGSIEDIKDHIKQVIQISLYHISCMSDASP